MNDFVKNLKAEATRNPALAVVAGLAALKGITKLIDTTASARSKNAYARRMNKSK